MLLSLWILCNVASFALGVTLTLKLTGTAIAIGIRKVRENG